MSDASKALWKAEKTLEERKALGEMRKGGFWATEIAAAIARLKVDLHSEPPGLPQGYDCGLKLEKGEPGAALRYLERVKRLVSGRYGEGSTRLVPVHRDLAKAHRSAGDAHAALQHILPLYALLKVPPAPWPPP